MLASPMSTLGNGKGGVGDNEGCISSCDDSCDTASERCCEHSREHFPRSRQKRINQATEAESRRVRVS